MTRRPARFVAGACAATLASLVLHGAPKQDDRPTPAASRHLDLIRQAAAWQRHAGDVGNRTGDRWPDLEGLGDRALRDRLAPVLRDLEADLRGDALSPHQAYAAYDALGSMGALAHPSIPTIVETMGRKDGDQSYRVPHLCSAAAALAAIAPTDPAVITTLARALDAELPARRGVCHRCGCLLEALQQSGPAARSIAGPVLERVMAEPRFITTYDWQLGRALAAIGIPQSARAALARATNPQVLPGDRAGTLKALAGSALSAADRTALRDTASTLLSSDLLDLRVAAAEALGATGAEAVPALARALGDAHLTVRAAAARSLERIGPGARSAAPALATALDPYLGTGLEVASALVAIGPDAAPVVRAWQAQAPSRVRAFAAAVAQAAQERRADLVGAALARFPRGPDGKGYAEVEVVAQGSGARPYQPAAHRIRGRFSVLRYDARGPAPAETSGAITLDRSFNAPFAALKGRVAGDRVRVLLSADIAQSPAYGSTRHRDAYLWHVLGTPGYFDVTIERVCEPVVWTIFRGGGIFGPIRFEPYCDD